MAQERQTQGPCRQGVDIAVGMTKDEDKEQEEILPFEQGEKSVSPHSVREKERSRKEKPTALGQGRITTKMLPATDPITAA